MTKEHPYHSKLVPLKLFYVYTERVSNSLSEQSNFIYIVTEKYQWQLRNIHELKLCQLQWLPTYYLIEFIISIDPIMDS